MPFLVRLVLRYSRGHFNFRTAVLLDHEVLAATYEAMHPLANLSLPSQESLSIAST
jgi:hypothetical protein